MGELSEQFDVHPNQITTWRTQLLEGAAEDFGGEGKAEAAPAPIDVKALHVKIGELTPTNDFLAGALAKAALRVQSDDRVLPPAIDLEASCGPWDQPRQRLLPTATGLVCRSCADAPD